MSLDINNFAKLFYCIISVKNTTTFVSTTLPYGHFFFDRDLDLYQDQQERDLALLFTLQRVPVKNLCTFFSTGMR